MKKLLAIILTLTLAFLLIGCTAEETTDLSNPVDTEVETPGKDEPVDTEAQAPNEDMPTDTEDEVKNDVVYNLNPMDRMSEILHFEIPARGEKSGIDISVEYNFDGRLIGATAVSGDIGVLGILSDTEIILDDTLRTYHIHQLYKLNLETKEAEPMLSEEVYGHTYDEYYDSVTKKWTWLEWCAHPTFNGTRAEDGTPMIAYYSNKYAENGVMTNEENCWENGAIWILDIETGVETRIPAPAGSEILGGARIKWHGMRNVLFEADIDGVTHYIDYNTDTGEYLTAELNHDEISALIDANLAFDNFRNSRSEGVDKRDRIYIKYEPLYRVTDERFDTPEKYEAYINTYFHNDYILNYINNWMTVRNGKVYRVESAWEHDYNSGYRFEVILIYQDQIRVRAYTELRDGPDFIQVAEYGFLMEDGKWKIDWVVRNCFRRTGWTNNDDFTDIPITAEEVSSLLEKDLYMWAHTNTTNFAISEPGVPFDYEDPANYIEKDVYDLTYRYYKVIDPDFDTWDKWETLAKSIYTDKKLNLILSNTMYTDVDGALYTMEGGGMGYYEDIGNYAWHITEYTDSRVTVLKRFGDDSENCETIYNEWVILERTPDGWRISEVFRT